MTIFANAEDTGVISTAAIRARADAHPVKVDLAKLVVTLVALIPFVLGWSLRKTVRAVTIVAAAFAEGWDSAHKPARKTE